jgi:hypothetical protein
VNAVLGEEFPASDVPRPTDLAVLLRRYGGQGVQVQLDAIRTAGTLVIGTDGR